jgi:hypothetical protein
MKAFECFTTYMAMKRHFSSDYDMFKYNGKLNNTSVSKFETRRDKYFFHKLSKLKNPYDFMLANIIKNANFWPGDVNNMDTHAVYVNWQKRQQSMSYMFKQDLHKMDDDFDVNIFVKDGMHPHLLKLILREDIGVETFIILNELTPFFWYWDNAMAKDPIWNDLKNKCEKYKPFFINNVDLKKFKSYTMEHFG